MSTKSKFLVDIFHQLSARSLLFLIWGSMVGVFVWLMVSHYRRMTRSNLKETPRQQKQPPSRGPSQNLPVPSTKNLPPKTTSRS